MRIPSVLLSVAIVPVTAASGAVVTNSFVQNKTVNWTQLPGAVASQSSLQAGGVAPRAIDGNPSGAWGGNSVTHTDNGESNGWWQVDLGVARDISEITLFNRTDCCGNRLSNYSVLAGNDSGFTTTLYDSGNQATAAGASISFSNIGQSAQYVRVQRNFDSLDGGNNAISLAEVNVLGSALFNYSNLSLGSSPSQSSTLGNTANPDATKAIDGNFTNSFNSGSTTHTNPGAGGPVFWETSLASFSAINEIALYNRGDCCGDRLSNFRVSIFDGANEVWGEDYFTGTGNAPNIFSVQEDAGGFIASGDRVRVELIGGLNNATSGADVLSLREVEIYGEAIPEPSGLALVTLGLLPLLRRRRK
jgi:hypothetical protein